MVSSDCLSCHYLYHSVRPGIMTWGAFFRKPYGINDLQ